MAKNDVIKAIAKEVDGGEKKDRTTDLSKPKFVGSSETRTYHTLDCKVGQKISQVQAWKQQRGIFQEQEIQGS